MTKIRQFKWQDRDTAAQEMLQVACYTPRRLALQALYLLRAFRSSAITNQLVEIVLDLEIPGWQRRYALIAAQQANNLNNHKVIAALKKQALNEPLGKIKRSTALTSLRLLPVKEYDPELAIILSESVDDFDRYRKIGWNGYDLIYDDVLFRQVYRHNVNLIYDEVASLNSDRAKFLLLKKVINQHNLINHDLDILFSLLDTHIEWLDLQLVRKLFDADIEEAYFWLDEHIEEVYWLILTYENKHHRFGGHHRLLDSWTDLREMVFTSSEEIKAEYTDYLNGDISKSVYQAEFEQSKVYQLFYQLSLNAKEGDETSYSKILRVAYHHTNIPIRALATKFLVGLHDRYDVEDTLCRLVKVHDDWHEENDPLWIYSPIRIEAIAGLKQIATPKAWQALIDAAFFKPYNELSYYLVRAIESVTNVLMGEEPIPENPKARNPPVSRWYRTLIDLEDVDLDV